MRPAWLSAQVKGSTLILADLQRAVTTGETVKLTVRLHSLREICFPRTFGTERARPWRRRLHLSSGPHELHPSLRRTRSDFVRDGIACYASSARPVECWQ